VRVFDRGWIGAFLRSIFGPRSRQDEPETQDHGQLEHRHWDRASGTWKGGGHPEGEPNSDGG
jgi:hypothetical protein